MAIPFLNNINLDDNQLLNAKLHVTSSAPTAAAGQIYFDSTAGVTSAKYYDGSAWVSLIQHTYNNGTFINLTEAGTDATRTLTADLSATGTPDATVYLRGDNTWSPISAIPGTYTFDVAADSGTDQTVNSGDTLEIQGISYITTIVGAGPVIEIEHDDTSRTDTTSTDAPGYGGTFEAVTSVTTNATGHVTAIDVSTVTIPASDNTTYLLGVGAGAGDTAVVTLDASSGTDTTLTIGVQDQALTISETTGVNGTVTLGLNSTIEKSITFTEDISIDGSLRAGGGITMEGASIEDLADPVNAQDAATKAYVDAATVGGLVYQGGYDANLNSPDLTTSPNSIEKGWTYTVTNDGTFFGEQLRVGDVLIAEVDDPSALTDWTTVQNNIDLASLSQVGIGNVNSDTNDTKLGISVGYSSGTASVGLDINGLTDDQLQEEPSSYDIPVYNDAEAINRKLNLEDLASHINSVTSFAATITDTATVTHNLNTKDVIVQLYDVTTDETVYADVERASVNTATITFATTPTNSIRVLVQKIG